MFITREMDYAVRILRALYHEQPLTSPQIAERENIQPAMTYKLMNRLSGAGLIKARRGARGGYTLLRPCEETTLYDVFRALSEPLLLTECLAAEHECPNNPCGACGVNREFGRIQRALNRELRHTTLAKLFGTRGKKR